MRIPGLLTLCGLLLSCKGCEVRKEPKLADGCRHVYVDLGTNVGHQIRKVYEPELYHGNPTEEIFRAHFGQYRDGVCSFGFEANPVHKQRLQRLEQYFLHWGKRVQLFTATAVSVQETNVTFYEDPAADAHNQWGASLSTETLADKEHLVPVTVPAVDIGCWMHSEVLGRQIPPGALQPSIVMKSDIEGHDMVVLSHLLATGVLCHVSEVYGEHISEEWVASTRDILQLANCTTLLTPLDDESGDDTLPLPSEHP